MLYYDEIFLSIQGESTDSGLPCIFIRLYGCPIGCSYCDQPQRPNDKKRISIQNIISILQKNYRWCRNVCLTGGEPLIQDDALPLVYELLSMGYSVSIETSGCVPIEERVRRSYKYVMDIKCPSSGVKHKNIYDNLLKLHTIDEVKFVVKDREDYEFMKSIIRKYPTSAKILVSPMFDPDGKVCIGEELINWILKDKLYIRVQIQMHKVLNVK